MRVAFVIGPCPPGQCGIGDYTACLAQTLDSIGVEVSLINSGRWSLVHGLATSQKLSNNFDIVHIEYPSLGFGRSLGPQGLSLLQSCVVTIHEVSRASIQKRMTLIPFTLRAERIIFTSSFERSFATKWFPWIESFTSVIPVGSNIPPSPNTHRRSLTEIVYFGLIAPGQGLEQVIELGNLIKMSELPLTIRVIGGVASKYVSYFDKMHSAAMALPIIWDRDLSEEKISERFARASIAYLPYPDGASERRTTLKAALMSGLSVVTTKGAHTPPELEGTVRFCQSSRQALSTIRCLLERPTEISEIGRKAVEYGQRYSWEWIAKEHLEVYDSVLRTRRQLISHSRAETLS